MQTLIDWILRPIQPIYWAYKRHGKLMLFAIIILLCTWIVLMRNGVLD